MNSSFSNILGQPEGWMLKFKRDIKEVTVLGKVEYTMPDKQQAICRSIE